MNSLEKPIYELLKTEPFFANFLLGAKITFDKVGVPTAGVRIVRDHIEFVINTEFFFTKPLPEQVAILKHEIMHVLLNHCGSRGGVLDPTAKNIAMDCAINQYLPEIKDGVTLATVSTFCKRKLLPMETYEYYYEHIKKAREKKGGGEDISNDHSFMEGDDAGLLPPAEAELQKAVIKNAIQKAMQASCGAAPSSLQRLFADFNKPAQLPWKQILRNFIANARSVSTIPTRLKPHRRFDFDQPGKKKLRKLVLGVCVDESGSVSDESFVKFMNEIKTVAKSTTVTYIVHADSEVHKVDTIKDGKAKSGVLGVRHATGGTMYAPAINECIKKGCDAILYFGDMDSSDTPKNPGVPFLWVRVGSSEPPGKFGRILDLV